MPKARARKPNSYVFVFRLGKGARAGKKRVPAELTSLLCYYYREDQARLAKKLLAIPEPDLAESEADVAFDAIDAITEGCELERELYSDDELEADVEKAQTRGFHIGATYEEAEAALVRGGFSIAQVTNPWAPVLPTPAEALAQSVQDLARHVDLTSLERVLEATDDGTDLPWHAGCAEYLVTHAFEQKDAHSGAFAAQVGALAPGLPAEVRDTLVMLVARVAHEAKAKAKAKLCAFLTSLPAAESPDVRAHLESFGLPSGTAKAKPETKAVLPKDAPKKAEAPKKKAPAKASAPTIDSLLAKVRADAAKAGVVLPPGATAAAIAKAEKKLGVTFPDDVRAFYAAHDGGPPNEGVCNGRELLSLAGIVRQWAIWKELFDDGVFEEEEVSADKGVKETWWSLGWIPVTYDFGGNHDVVDLDPAKGGKRGQIVSVWHDDESREIEGDSFLSWLADAKWTAFDSGD